MGQARKANLDSMATRPRPILNQIIGPLGVAAALGMLLVLIMGATVTSTGSAQGCARDWPLCRGQFIPQFTVSTLIEFSHRAVTAVESLLIFALAAAALALWRSRRTVILLVTLMLTSLFVQAGMGAAAVKWPQQPVVLALHFGISLVALAATALTAAYVRHPERRRTPQSDSRGLAWAAWGALAYIYLLVYSGALISHTGAAQACTSWPGCTSGAPMAGYFRLLDLGHRLAAGGAIFIALGLILIARRCRPERPHLVRAAIWFLATLGLQAVAGVVLVLSHFDLFGELLHSGVTGVVFVAASYVCFLVAVGDPAASPGAVGSESGVLENAR